MMHPFFIYDPDEDPPGADVFEKAQQREKGKFETFSAQSKQKQLIYGWGAGGFLTAGIASVVCSFVTDSPTVSLAAASLSGLAGFGFYKCANIAVDAKRLWRRKECEFESFNSTMEIAKSLQGFMDNKPFTANDNTVDIPFTVVQDKKPGAPGV